MLLIYNLCSGFIDWIITHLNEADFFFKVMCALWGGICIVIGWIFHGFKYKRIKRHEAQAAIYQAIHNTSILFKEELMQKERLYISNPYNCNSISIYTLNAC